MTVRLLHPKKPGLQIDAYALAVVLCLLKGWEAILKM